VKINSSLGIRQSSSGAARKEYGGGGRKKEFTFNNVKLQGAQLETRGLGDKRN